MNVYKGAYRRQVGGNIFGQGFRQAIPYIFRQIVNMLKPRLISAGKAVGKSVLRAGVGAAGNLINNNFTNAKEAIIEPFESEVNEMKRKYLPGLNQKGSGKKRRKLSINKTKKRSKKHSTLKKKRPRTIKKTKTRKPRGAIKKKQIRKRVTKKLSKIKDIFG